jgi:N-acyl-D-aspartate/D-glutamate deacylase
VRVAGDRVVAVGVDLPPAEGEEVIDASGAWVTPGFIDMHTHYDAEVELEPRLLESVRHGVTTVLLGSCGLSMAMGRPVDLADMFCRVEGIPRATVLPLFERLKDWDDPAGYLDHLERLPLGPNVACLLGHSTIRAAAMGIGRSLDADTRPDAGEMAAMERTVESALEAGFLGLSINTLPWDKMDGDAHRSRPLPSVYATWAEYRRLMRPLRRRGRILQGVPNLVTKVNIFLFALASAGVFRRGLKTTLIALMDPKSDRVAPRIAAALARIVNTVLGGNLRFQALPNPFDLWTDGLEVPVLEEIGAGTRALHETDPRKRAALLRDPAYRARFRREWAGGFLGRAYHRDLRETEILACPDPTVVGRSFAAVAAERGVEAVDAFLDLQATHGNALRWYTVVANDRPDALAWILRHPDILIGFSDAGAHLRNMAYYNFPMRLLWRAHVGGVLPVERAVHRLSGELADWLGIDAGRLAVGRRADVVVVDPAGLDESVERVEEAPVPGFADLNRVVRRSDRAVRAVLVAGRLAWDGRQATPAFGRERGFGRVLRANA